MSIFQISKSQQSVLRSLLNWHLYYSTQIPQIFNSSSVEFYCSRHFNSTPKGQQRYGVFIMISDRISSRKQSSPLASRYIPSHRWKCSPHRKSNDRLAAFCRSRFSPNSWKHFPSDPRFWQTFKSRQWMLLPDVTALLLKDQPICRWWRPNLSRCFPNQFFTLEVIFRECVVAPVSPLCSGLHDGAIRKVSNRTRRDTLSWGCWQQTISANHKWPTPEQSQISKSYGSDIWIGF